MFRYIFTITFILLIILSGSPMLSQTISNDTTPPLTTISYSPPQPTGQNGWYVNSVLFTLNASDNESGVNATYYKIDNGNYQRYFSSFQLSNDGIHYVYFYSVDNAGNIEAEKHRSLKLDLQPPVVKLYLVPTLIKYRTFLATCNDSVSGMEKVEFYLGPYLQYTDYDQPYKWKLNPEPTMDDFPIIAVAYDYAGNSNRSSVRCVLFQPSAVGIIRDVRYTPTNITFFAIHVHTEHGWVTSKSLSYPINYGGFIGKHFVRAIFWTCDT